MDWQRCVRKTGVLVLSAAIGCGPALGQSCGSGSDTASHTHVGQQMPAISLTESDGTHFDLRALRGKVVFVNFWATWCGPCRLEMPRLETEIWQANKNNPNFRMVAIAREQTDAEVKAFQKKSPYTFPLAADPKRSTYALFADAYIPRSYVVGRDGTILAQTSGYCEADFDHLKTVLARALKPAP